MKGGGKKKGSSEAPNGAAAANTNGTNGVNALSAPLGKADQTQLQIGEGHEGQGQELEGQAEEVAVEEEEEEKEDDNRVAEEAERPKLDEGFYEIEAIRRRRVRKGELQYLIKWRGWPETANTWEPLENLQSCSDVIEAFEDSLRSGKHRRRKGKNVVPQTQPKKKQQRSTIATYSLTAVGSSDADKHLQSVPLNDLTLSDLPVFPQALVSTQEEQSSDVSNHEKPKIADENRCFVNVSDVDESKEKKDYDPKLSELKATTSTNGVDVDKFAIHFQEGKALEGNGHLDGPSKVYCHEPVQSSHFRGAKRRKSGSVKRFKKDSYLCESVDIQDASRVSMSGGRVEQPDTEIPEFVWNSSSLESKIDDFKNASGIIKIIKPIGFSASVSSNIQDVLVTFMAMRSDGTVVMVDNKFLKANNPLLLINFYEQHLRYSPTP
ncbi:Chromo domain-containing protein LHP1 [Quillaja saponaria]|uniref:Chromo domain-containing protein LHP1 n=1 Tax=Quillaja saponaria TaxID=32244 RepID=A0AAD7PDC3_QUISA|nr:Chromo domain-containing protein LHP1 [Quillaja saponaria]